MIFQKKAKSMMAQIAINVLAAVYTNSGGLRPDFTVDLMPVTNFTARFQRTQIPNMTLPFSSRKSTESAETYNSKMGLQCLAPQTGDLYKLLRFTSDVPAGIKAIHEPYNPKLWPGQIPPRFPAGFDNNKKWENFWWSVFLTQMNQQ